MSNNKQSSVEWLQAIELERDLTLADWNKAKAMHKDEICKAYVYGSAYGIDISNGLKPDNYYNETFNNESTN